MKKIVGGIIIAMQFFLSSSLLAQTSPFVPESFEVPVVFENHYFRLRTLTAADVEKDYEAVMSCLDHLQGSFGPTSSWPTSDLSFEQDLKDLQRHENEFDIRSSFTYTVVSLDEETVLGCVYIYPSNKKEFDAQIILWVRADVVDDGYDTILYETVKNWLAEEWPLQNPGYPGRDIAWEDWESAL